MSVILCLDRKFAYNSGDTYLFFGSRFLAFELPARLAFNSFDERFPVRFENEKQNRARLLLPEII